jgi:hypothetical protein
MVAVLKFTSQVQMLDMTLDPASLDWVYACDTLTTPTPTEAADVSVAIQHFYTTTATGSTQHYAQYMAPSVDNTAGIHWEAYDITGHLDGSPHGSPIASNTYAFGTPGSAPSPVPEGVAASLSYRRDYGTDVEFIRDPVTHKVTSRPRGQDRGRMYLGPLNSNALAFSSGTSRCVLSTTFMANIIAQLQASLKITDSGSNLWHFKQWSRKKASVADLALIWMDDRPDYQRRRTDQSTTRQQATPSY